MVTAAKPKSAVAGAVHVAPIGTTLPTTADGALDQAFIGLGYNTEDGLTRSVEKDTEIVKAWGGDVVLVLDNGKTETFKFSMLDAHSTAALKLLNGDDNVSGTALATGISVTSNNKEQSAHAFVIDMIEQGNTLHRVVIPKGIVTEIEDITYVDSDALAYGITLTALADSENNTVYEYYKTASTSGT